MRETGSSKSDNKERQLERYGPWLTLSALLVVKEGGGDGMISQPPSYYRRVQHSLSPYNFQVYDTVARLLALASAPLNDGSEHGSLKPILYLVQF